MSAAVLLLAFTRNCTRFFGTTVGSALFTFNSFLQTLHSCDSHHLNGCLCAVWMVLIQRDLFQSLNQGRQSGTQTLENIQMKMKNQRHGKKFACYFMKISWEKNP